MRRRIQLRTVSEESNEAANMWIQHLVNRMILQELKLPLRLQAKMLHQTLQIKNK